MSEDFWACEGCKKEFDTFDEAEEHESDCAIFILKKEEREEEALIEQEGWSREEKAQIEKEALEEEEVRIEQEKKMLLDNSISKEIFLCDGCGKEFYTFDGAEKHESDCAIFILKKETREEKVRIEQEAREKEVRIEQEKIEEDAHSYIDAMTAADEEGYSGERSEGSLSFYTKKWFCKDCSLTWKDFDNYDEAKKHESECVVFRIKEEIKDLQIPALIDNRNISLLPKYLERDESIEMACTARNQGSNGIAKGILIATNKKLRFMRKGFLWGEESVAHEYNHITSAKKEKTDNSGWPFKISIKISTLVGDAYYNWIDETEAEMFVNGLMKKIDVEKGNVKINQTIVQGDQVTKTKINDSVINRSNVGAGGKSKSKELREAKALLEDGIIDDDEFKQMKKEILGK